MYCTNCGKHNPENSEFCKYCGTKFNVKKITSENGTPYTYIISIPKLVILSTVTFGLYDIYWFYKQWKSFKKERDLKVTPWARALFATLMSYSLFKEISKAVKSVDKTRSELEAGALASAYFILVILYRLPAPYWWLSLFSVLPLIPVQKAINFYWERKYENKRILRSNFGLWNWIWTIIGGILLLLGLYGTLSSSNMSNSNSQNGSSTSIPVSITPAYVDNQTLMQTNTQAVVNILCNNQDGGSGTVWVKDGLIVTNNHVIAGSTSCLVTIPDVTSGAPVQIYQAKPLIAPNLSKQYDIAMLSVYAAYKDTDGKVWGTYPISLHEFVPPSNCAATRLGDTVRIYGYPVTSGGYNLTITDGIVSSFADNGNILTSAKIDSGNSGGLAVDQNGCMLGIPSAVLTGNYQNLGVIIPDNVIRDFINKASSQNSDSNSQVPKDTPAYAPQSYQSQTNSSSENPPEGGYQNYGWYMHSGSSMQYVNGNWYSTPQQNISPTPTTSWWGY